MLVDTGSSVDILYLGAYDRLGLHSRRSHENFDDKRIFHDSDGLIGRPILTALRAIVSPLHLKMKFPTMGGVGKASGD
ncbi:hypothetical protein LIER_31296 [Lithospermum erythrorhizon]|uniref:Peptidase A2 domain-containing protein n=1 Tax=Lithospermum erythrorhizon TaxID=34254 RepID=A0AAV3RTR1_LITER